jgi:single-stranded DNA-binding protein
MNDIDITIIGNVASDVSLNFTKGGVSVAHFRVAAGTRRFDRQSERWTDGDTHFFSISCFRDLAHNVVASVTKGQPIIVRGRLRSRESIRECGEHMHTFRYYDVEASVVGHDLSRGNASFTRVKRAAVIENETRYLADSMAEAGIAEEDEARALASRLLGRGADSELDCADDPDDLDDDEVIDPQTGEIIERVRL